MFVFFKKNKLQYYFFNDFNENGAYFSEVENRCYMLTPGGKPVCRCCRGSYVTNRMLILVWSSAQRTGTAEKEKQSHDDDNGINSRCATEIYFKKSVTPSLGTTFCVTRPNLKR